MDKLEILREQRDAWYEDRPRLAEYNSDPIRLTKLLLNEVQELLEAFEQGLELKDIEQELADVGWMLFGLEKVLDTDIIREMLEKHAFNLVRYTAELFQNGLSYEEARAIVKQREKDEGLREEFYG